MKVEWSPESKDSINYAFDRISENSPQNAEMVVERIFELGDSLGFMPYKYPHDPFVNLDNVRFATIFSYKIVYRIEIERVYILDVFFTGQHPQKLSRFR